MCIVISQLPHSTVLKKPPFLHAKILHLFGFFMSGAAYGLLGMENDVPQSSICHVLPKIWHCILLAQGWQHWLAFTEREYIKKRLQLQSSWYLWKMQWIQQRETVLLRTVNPWQQTLFFPNVFAPTSSQYKGQREICPAISSSPCKGSPNISVRSPLGIKVIASYV